MNYQRFRAIWLLLTMLLFTVTDAQEKSVNAPFTDSIWAAPASGAKTAQNSPPVIKNMSFPKDSLILMTGEITKAVIIDDTSLYGVRIMVSENKRKKSYKERFIPGVDIFAIHYASGRQKIMYRQDSTIGNFFLEEDARMYVLGQQEAQKYYRNKKPFFIGYGIGTLSGIWGNYFALVPPFVYGGLSYSPRVRIKEKQVSNPNLLENDRFVQGYERVARKKRVWTASSGSFAGLLTGLAIFNIYIYHH